MVIEAFAIVEDGRITSYVLLAEKNIADLGSDILTGTKFSFKWNQLVLQLHMHCYTITNNSLLERGSNAHFHVSSRGNQQAFSELLLWIRYHLSHLIA